MLASVTSEEYPALLRGSFKIKCVKILEPQFLLAALGGSWIGIVIPSSLVLVLNHGSRC